MGLFFSLGRLGRLVRFIPYMRISLQALSPRKYTADLLVSSRLSETRPERAQLQFVVACVTHDTHDVLRRSGGSPALFLPHMRSAHRHVPFFLFFFELSAFALAGLV